MTENLEGALATSAIHQYQYVHRHLRRDIVRGEGLIVFEEHVLFWLSLAWDEFLS